MNFEFVPKENPRNTFLEHCVNKGDNFEVEIVHWNMIDKEIKNKLPSAVALMGNECWNVYATINKGHPLYERMKDVETDDYDNADERIERIFVAFTATKIKYKYRILQVLSPSLNCSRLRIVQGPLTATITSTFEGMSIAGTFL